MECTRLEMYQQCAYEINSQLPEYCDAMIDFFASDYSPRNKALENLLHKAREDKSLGVWELREFTSFVEKLMS